MSDNLSLTTDSTALDIDSASLAAGNGAPALADATAPEDDSIEGVLAAEFKSIKEAEGKPDSDADEAEGKDDEPAKGKAPAKAEKTVKVEKPAEVDRADESDAEAEAAAKPKAEPKAESRAEEQPRGRHVEPPARFLPEARTKWANVPNEIKAEFHRVSDELEREIGEHRQFREELREYEDLARTHNVTIKDTMQRYVEADRALHQNFGQGIAHLAGMYGHSPAQAIASVMQGFGITPQQYAQAIAQNPQLAQAMPPNQMARAPEPRQPQVDPQQMIQQVKAEMRREFEAETAVSNFASSHPDFEQLAPQIKGILDSGVISQLYGNGLTYEQKLAEAYRMAGGSPSLPQPAAEATHSEPDARPVNPDAGKKSVRGAPSNGEDAASDETETDLSDLLRKEMKKLTARH